ncbi:hypothetical protein AABM27_16695, partial [Heyndrickxia faecalis]|uniref:hypothetical protein n=1 Tax=Heyndrickxia faecalis TaxID=2824910 RepID=UPI0031012636
AILSSKKANYSQTFVIFTNFYGKEYRLQKISYTTQQILHKKMAFFSGHESNWRHGEELGLLRAWLMKPCVVFSMIKMNGKEAVV